MANPQTQVTEESAKQLAQQYADRYFKGFTVDKVLPFAGMSGMTMYQAELKGPKDEARILHINPWENVMPFGGPQARLRWSRVSHLDGGKALRSSKRSRFRVP